MKKHFLTVVYAIDDKPETVAAILAQRPWQAVAHTDALKDLEHAQADLTAAMDGYDAAWIEVASLKKTMETYKQSGMDFAARVQALERTADKLREENAALQQRDDDWHKEHSNALVEMAKRTHAMDAKNLGLLHALTAEQDENHALHQQLAAIGAGGVEPLRKRECLHSISEPAQELGHSAQTIAMTANVAGLESAVAHLSCLLDAFRALLVEVDDVCGRDGFDRALEDGESEIIDKIRAALAMTNAAPQPAAQALDAKGGRWITVVYRDIAAGQEARELGEHPNVCAMSWSHALNERDAAIAAQQGAKP